MTRNPGAYALRAGATCLSALILLSGCASLQLPTPQQANQIGLEAPPAQPQSRALYLKLISDLRASGRTRAALAHLDKFDALYRRDPRARILRADCLVDIQDYAGAELIYRGQIRMRRQAAEAYAGLGRIAGAREDWRGAAGYFYEAVKRAPIAPTYLNDLGFALMRSGDYDGAVFRLRQASELAPGDTQARNNLIVALNASGDTQGARQLLEQISDPAQRDQVAAAMAASPKAP